LFGYIATGINLRLNPGLKAIVVDPSVIQLGSKFGLKAMEQLLLWILVEQLRVIK